MSAYPTLPPVIPGELVTTQCSECYGSGVTDYLADFDGNEWPVSCGRCDGHGTVDVCPVCGITPDAFSDACGCTEPLCEACETKLQATEGLCKNCIQEAVENYAHELSVVDAEQEILWAQSVGWL